MLKALIVSLILAIGSTTAFAQVDLDIINNTGCDFEFTFYTVNAACGNKQNHVVNPVYAPGGGTVTSIVTAGGQLFVDAEVWVAAPCPTPLTIPSAVGSPGWCYSCPGNHPNFVIWRTACGACQYITMDWDDCGQTLVIQ